MLHDQTLHRSVLLWCRTKGCRDRELRSDAVVLAVLLLRLRSASLDLHKSSDLGKGHGKRSVNVRRHRNV